MRNVIFRLTSTLCLSASLAVSPAWAGDKPLTAPAPGWILPAPALTTEGTRSPWLLFDEQVLVDGSDVIAYFDTAKRVTRAEDLAAIGTFSMKWQPSHGDFTVHRMEIQRGTQTIDLLKDGLNFTVLRREAGLEQKVVDGQLTAVRHIEGLQIGDIVRTAFSLTQRDPVLKGNVQDGLLLLPRPLELGFGRARLVWRQSQALTWKALMPGVSLVPKPLPDGRNEIVVDLPVAKLPEMPANMPVRFRPLPAIQFSSFANWATVAELFAPLYQPRGTIAEGSDLAKAVDAIAAQSADPVARMAGALQLVQDDVRYQLIALGTGNYVPQAPAETWRLRYGDCKAKTLLLLAVLDRLGIRAEPVLAHTERGDAVSTALPSAAAFDHVFVRAEVAGESFWLDGTLLGSRLADIRDVPRYGTVLPLFTGKGALIDLPRRARTRPDVDVTLAYDMAAGPHLPAPFQLKLAFTGLFAQRDMVAPGADYAERLTTYAEKAAKSWTGSTTIGHPTARLDPQQGAWIVTINGVGYPDWAYEDGHYRLSLDPTIKVTMDAPRGRSAWQKIPALIDNPWTAHSTLRIALPATAQPPRLTGAEPAQVILPAVDWRRSAVLAEGQLVEEITSRESGAEIAPEDVSGTSRTIGEAMKRQVHVELPDSYPQRWDDVPSKLASPAIARIRAIFDERIADKPEDTARLSDRGWLKERLFDLPGAEADYGRAIALDPSAELYLQRANLRARRGDHAGALADARAAFDSESGNDDVRGRLARELAIAGEVDEAIALLPQNPDLGNDDGIDALLQQVDLLETGNRDDEAMALLDAAVDKRPASAELRNSRCWFKALRNVDLDTALADCNRAIELSSDPARYLDSRALVHVRAERLPQARADYEAALAAAPEQASSLYMRALVLDRLGQRAAASASLRAARTINPDIDRFYKGYGLIAPAGLAK